MKNVDKTRTSPSFIRFGNVGAGIRYKKIYTPELLTCSRKGLMSCDNGLKDGD